MCRISWTRSYPNRQVQLPRHIVEAKSPKGNQIVAKLVRKDSAELSLLRELSTQTSLHNHVIPLLDTVPSSLGLLAIIPYLTPLPQIVSLRLFRDRLGDKSAHLSRELIEGVAFLHRRNIAHMDIKPDNLVYESDRLYIIDFDVAVRCKDADEMVKMSCGTRGWSAPEVVLDDDEATCAFSPIRADLWSCGKVLQYITEAGQNDEDFIQLASLLMDSDPRRRPLLHEAVDEGLDFWTSGRLLQAVRSQVYSGKAGALKRAHVDTSHVGKGTPSSKVRRASVSTTAPSPSFSRPVGF